MTKDRALQLLISLRNNLDDAIDVMNTKAKRVDGEVDPPASCRCKIECHPDGPGRWVAVLRFKEHPEEAATGE